MYHRLLEFYLYLKQMNEKKISTQTKIGSRHYMEPDSFQKTIEQFIVNHDTKIDSNYILFLF